MLTELLKTWTELSQQRIEITRHDRKLTKTELTELTRLNLEFDKVDIAVKAEVQRITRIDVDSNVDFRLLTEVSGWYGLYPFYLKIQPDRLIYVVSANPDINPKLYGQPRLEAEDIPEGIFYQSSSLHPENRERWPNLMEHMVWYGCRSFHKWLVGIRLGEWVNGKPC